MQNRSEPLAARSQFDTAVSSLCPVRERPLEASGGSSRDALLRHGLHFGLDSGQRTGHRHLPARGGTGVFWAAADFALAAPLPTLREVSRGRAPSVHCSRRRALPLRLLALLLRPQGAEGRLAFSLQNRAVGLSRDVPNVEADRLCDRPNGFFRAKVEEMTRRWET